jgi:hypothetical protein
MMTMPRVSLAGLLAVVIVAWATSGCAAVVAPLPTPAQAIPEQASTPTATPRPPTATPPAGLISVTGPGVPSNVLDDIATALRQGAPGVCAALDVACDFPVTVEVFADQAAFDRGVMNPEMRGYYALSGDGRIQMVSPANSGRDELSYEDGVGVAVHEFVHLALDQIDPELPDWLEEGTAVYLGPHTVYDRACRQQLAGVDLPPLADLRYRYSDVPAADLMAYTLVASIAGDDGYEALNALLHAPEAMEATLARSTAEVEAEWRTFVSRGCVIDAPDR